MNKIHFNRHPFTTGVAIEARVGKYFGPFWSLQWHYDINHGMAD